MLEWIVGTAGYLGVSAGVAKGQFNYLRNHEIESDYKDNLRYNDPEKALKRAKESADRYADINIIPALFMGILWPVAAPLVFGTRGLQKRRSTSTSAGAVMSPASAAATSRLESTSRTSEAVSLAEGSSSDLPVVREGHEKPAGSPSEGL